MQYLMPQSLQWLLPQTRPHNEYLYQQASRISKARRTRLWPLAHVPRYVLKHTHSLVLTRSLPGMHHARHAVLASPACSWVLIDCEHGIIPLTGPGGVGECVTGICASSDNPPAAIVRIPAMGHTTSASWQIGLALDAGAKGVMVPMVNTKADAEMVAKWSKFPPVGSRGFGNPATQEVRLVTLLVYHVTLLTLE